MDVLRHRIAAVRRRDVESPLIAIRQFDLYLGRLEVQALELADLAESLFPGEEFLQRRWIEKSSFGGLDRQFELPPGIFSLPLSAVGDVRRLVVLEEPNRKQSVAVERLLEGGGVDGRREFDHEIVVGLSKLPDDFFRNETLHATSVVDVGDPPAMCLVSREAEQGAALEDLRVPRLLLHLELAFLVHDVRAYPFLSGAQHHFEIGFGQRAGPRAGSGSLATSRGEALQELADRMRRDEPELPSVDFLELVSDRMARADALRVVAECLGDDAMARTATATADAQARAAESDDALVEKADRARSMLEALRGSDLDGRRRGRGDAERARLEARLESERTRLGVAVDATAHLGRFQRSERARLKRLADGHRRAIGDIERRLHAVPESRSEDPPSRRDRAEAHAVEFVQAERELARRMLSAYDRAELTVHAGPASDLVERLAARPSAGPERELWERRATRLELHRARYGRLPAPAAPPLGSELAPELGATLVSLPRAEHGAADIASEL